MKQVSPDVFVKGGTTTSKWDNDRAELRAAAELGRQHQDRQRLAVRRGAKDPKAGIGALLTNKFGGNNAAQNPMLAMVYASKDRSQEVEGLVDLIETTTDGEPDLAMIIVCPDCMVREQTQAYAQMMVRQSQKGWELTPYPLDDPKFYQHPQAPDVFVPLIGEVTMDETAWCTGLGCSYGFRINRNRIYREWKS